MKIMIALVFCSLFLIPALTIAGDIPTILTCTINAHASRDYGFLFERAWMGPIPDFSKTPDNAQPFIIITKPSQDDIIPLRDKVFSGLNTAKPIVRSITPATKYAEEDAVEFKATIVGRFEDTIFLMWTNEQNKVWLAAVNLKYRKATISQVFQGITSIGVEAETFDCK